MRALKSAPDADLLCWSNEDAAPCLRFSRSKVLSMGESSEEPGVTAVLLLYR